MSAMDSNLSSTGFDIVVAATQSSINDTMKAYLAEVAQPEVTLCYVAGPNGVPTPIPYATLMANARGTDPFSVPASADPTTDPDLQNLFGARFLFGIRASIGLPPGYAPTALPNLLTLGANTSTVIYTLTCSEFTLVQYTPASGYGEASWMNQSQPDGDAWLFTSQVNLSLSSAEFAKLPAAVQANIDNTGGTAFSVQQLLFDLNTAALQTVPQLQGVKPGTSLYSALENDFVGAYFATVQQNGSPVLGYSVSQSDAPPSTLPLTDLNFWSAPYLAANGQPIPNPTADQQAAYTLNYLCSTGGDMLPAPQGFGWNWVDVSEAATYDGVVAVNRNTFVNYLRTQLMPYVRSNCYQPWVQVQLDSSSEPVYSCNAYGGQTPAVTMPATGTTVLTYAFSSSARSQAGLDGDMGQMALSSSFTLDVTFQGNVITITQHLVMNAYIKRMLTGVDGNVVDKTIVDTYTITADENGRITAPGASTVTDNSQTPTTNAFLNFFTDLNSMTSQVAGWARNVAATSMEDIPSVMVQNFVFPGGKTFVFKDATFSNYQDLVAHFTYADPS